MNMERTTLMPSVEMVFNLTCLVRHDSEASVFVSHCPALGVYSQGETQEEANEAIKSAVTLFIEAAFDFDRLDQTLRRAGFKPVAPGTQLPESTEFIGVAAGNTQEINISVPVTLLASQTPSECLQ
jgi:predicted RNase H-like HicB family nuclease